MKCDAQKKISPFVRVALALGVTASVAAAQTSLSPAPLPLDALVIEVLDKNPELAFYRAELAAAKGEQRNATVLANPELATSIGSKRAKDAAGNVLGEGAAWSVALQQPFEWPGRLALRKAIASRQVALAELGLENFRSALAARTRTLAFGVFAAQQQADAALEVSHRLQALAEVVVQRDPAGVTPKLEQRIIEASAIVARKRAADAHVAVRNVLIELNQLRGQPLTSPVRIAESPLNLVPTPDVADLLALARTNNFELRQRIAELEQQGFKVDLAKNERYPAVTVGPFISGERAGDRERTVGVGVSFPLPLWNRNAGNIEVAQARREQAQTTLDVAQREVERKVSESYIQYQARLAEISHARPDASQDFRETADLADRHYRLGAVPLATYIEMQKQYLEALEALLDTKRSALEAREQLHLLTGRSLTPPVQPKKD
ncbi:MAG: TolC family protein [Verrucomicrobia bacterium]|nr:TolC family protein [Verrucomicrobiota bacterium]